MGVGGGSLEDKEKLEVRQHNDVPHTFFGKVGKRPHLVPPTPTLHVYGETPDSRHPKQNQPLITSHHANRRRPPNPNRTALRRN